MATVRFYTRSSRKDILATVSVLFAEGRKKTEAGVNDKAFEIRVTTPLRMVPAYWDRKKQAIKKNIIYDKGEVIDGKKRIFTEPEALETVQRFEEIRKQIIVEYNNLEGKPTKAWLQSVIEKIIKRDTPAEESLNDYIYRFICEATSGKRLATVGSTKKRYSPGSLRILRDFQRSFDHFQGIYIDRFYSEAERIKGKTKIRDKKTRPYRPLNWIDVNIDTYNNFVQYFYDRGCSDNYIGKHIKSWKTIMRQAREEGLHNSNEVDRKAFKTISSEVDHIYLTQDELKRLYELDLSGDRVLKIARDVFLVGCYLAQRYSDYKRINKSMLKVVGGVKYIELTQQKTGEKCLIPLRPEADKILQEYDYTLPKTHEQKINGNIKKIGLLAKITDPVHTETMRGGLVVKTDKKKCELIKTHTARRTGVTLMYLAGIPIVEIMKISGHRTPKEFMKYIRITKEETAVKLAKHPYFSGLKVV